MFLNIFWTLDTNGNSQRPVLSLGVPQHMHKITNLENQNSWKITSFSKTMLFQSEPFLTMFYIITPLTNILPFSLV